MDPGPGALAHARGRALGLDPGILDAIVLTHKHLDHSGDVNAMIEAMTQGGTKKRGRVLAPRDAYDEDPVILQLRPELSGRHGVPRRRAAATRSAATAAPSSRRRSGSSTRSRPTASASSGRRCTVGLVACTGYMPEIETALRADLLILNVVYREPRDEIHLALPDARQLIAAMRPRLAILTHFGLTMLRARPWELAETLSRETGVRVLAARDRWRLDLDAELGAGLDLAVGGRLARRSDASTMRRR